MRVFDHHGDALAGSGSPEGLYHRDTRYLSHFRLSLEGQRPLLLSSTVRDDNAVLICDLTNSESLDRPKAGCLRRTSFMSAARAFSGLDACSNGWRCTTTTSAREACG